MQRKEKVHTIKGRTRRFSSETNVQGTGIPN